MTNEEECQRCGAFGGYGCYECIPDHAQAELQAAVVAEREACAELADGMHEAAIKWAASYIPEFDGDTDSKRIAEAIRARSDTDALAARDARVRAEALKKAVVNLKTYAPHLEDGPEHDVGYYHGYYTAVDRILALIPDQHKENLLEDQS